MNVNIGAFHGVESNFFSLVCNAKHNFGGIFCYATGDTNAACNPAIVHQIDDSFAEQLAACKVFYRGKAPVWSLYMPEYLMSHQAELALQQEKMVLQDEGVAMIRKLQDPFPALSGRLAIKEMDEDLSTWSIPVISGFESTFEKTQVYLKRHQEAIKPGAGISHFTAFVSDTPVSSLTLTVLGKFARIDDFATGIEHQRKGYASELMIAVLKHAQLLKVEKCFLEASAAGLTVYQRLGFKELFKNLNYECAS